MSEDTSSVDLDSTQAAAHLCDGSARLAVPCTQLQTSVIQHARISHLLKASAEDTWSEGRSQLAQAHGFAFADVPYKNTLMQHAERPQTL